MSRKEHLDLTQELETQELSTVPLSTNIETDQVALHITLGNGHLLYERYDEVTSVELTPSEYLIFKELHTNFTKKIMNSRLIAAYSQKSKQFTGSEQGLYHLIRSINRKLSAAQVPVIIIQQSDSFSYLYHIIR